VTVTWGVAHRIACFFFVYLPCNSPPRPRVSNSTVKLCHYCILTKFARNVQYSQKIFTTTTFRKSNQQVCTGNSSEFPLSWYTPRANASGFQIRLFSSSLSLTLSLRSLGVSALHDRDSTTMDFSNSLLWFFLYFMLLYLSFFLSS